MRILVVEDDARIAGDIQTSLDVAGFTVVCADDGEDGWHLGETEAFDAVVLDLGLPQLDGLTILKRWRKAGRGFPVLVLTARDAWDERVEGINAGADDYLGKPFRMEEVLARVRALVRRAAGHASPMIEVGDLALDTLMMRVTREGKPIALTPQEYRLVAYLMHQCGRVVGQQELVEHLYDQDFERESNSVEVLVGRARRKLGAQAIRTQRGFGYVMGGDET